MCQLQLATLQYENYPDIVLQDDDIQDIPFRSKDDGAISEDISEVFTSHKVTPESLIAENGNEIEPCNVIDDSSFYLKARVESRSTFRQRLIYSTEYYGRNNNDGHIGMTKQPSAWEAVRSNTIDPDTKTYPIILKPLTTGKKIRNGGKKSSEVFLENNRYFFALGRNEKMGIRRRYYPIIANTWQKAQELLTYCEVNNENAVYFMGGNLWLRWLKSTQTAKSEKWKERKWNCAILL